jgi:hypothetical protein
MAANAGRAAFAGDRPVRDGEPAADEEGEVLEILVGVQIAEEPRPTAGATDAGAAAPPALAHAIGLAYFDRGSDGGGQHLLRQKTIACSASGEAMNCSHDCSAWNRNRRAMPASTMTSGAICLMRAIPNTAAEATHEKKNALAGTSSIPGTGSRTLATIAKAAPKPAPAEMPSV